MKKLNKCIGIISYLPDNTKDREIRISALQRTLSNCDKLFTGIDIIIIAQNWKEFNLNTNNKIFLYRYKNRLGILGARKKLREVFLQSDYDYLIMLDDDSSIQGESAEDYLNQIDLHPNMAGEFTKNGLILFAISKYAYEKIKFPDNVKTENGEIFDDEYIHGILDTYYPDLVFKFDKKFLNENTLGLPNMPSTWWDGSRFKIKDIQNKTKKLVLEYKPKEHH